MVQVMLAQELTGTVRLSVKGGRVFLTQPTGGVGVNQFKE